MSCGLEKLKSEFSATTLRKAATKRHCQPCSYGWGAEYHKNIIVFVEGVDDLNEKIASGTLVVDAADNQTNIQPFLQAVSDNLIEQHHRAND